VIVTSFNDSQNRRERFDDERSGSRAGDGAASYDDFIMPDRTRASGSGPRRTPEAFSRAKDKVQRGISGAQDTMQRGISGAQDYVKSHDFEDVVEDARNVARRNPRVAIVALMAVGFVIGRLLRRPR